MEGNRVPQYRMLAKAVLLKAVCDAKTAVRDDVLQFLRTPLYHTYCDLADIPADNVRHRILEQRTAPQHVDIFRRCVKVYDAQSITDACRYTGDSTNTIRRLMVSGKESQRHFGYRKAR